LFDGKSIDDIEKGDIKFLKDSDEFKSSQKAMLIWEAACSKLNLL
jgi:hypothetical protein